MRIRPRVRAVLTSAAVGAAMAVAATPASSQDRPLRVGLALSGGSAKGLAHVGVLRVLEREGIAVDVVAGTSMGSIVGGLYAMGVGADSLTALSTGLDWDALFTDRVERTRLTPDQRAFDARTVLSLPFADGRVRLPSAAVEGAAIQRLLARLTWPAAAVRDFRRLPRPFAAVATDLDTGEGVSLTTGVLADAMRASLAIPGAIEPLRLDERILVDGGLSRNLPAQDARALGADLVICSDVSEPLDPADELVSFVDVLMQTVAWSSFASTLEQRQQCDVLILPDIDDLTPLDFDAASEWIRRGEAAADAVVAELRAVGARAGGLRAGPRDPGAVFPGRLADSVRISTLTIEGSAGPAVVGLVERALGVDRDAVVSRERLDGVLEDLYATGLVGPVRYRLDTAGDSVALVVRTEGASRDRVGLGFRYDDRQRAALLFTATLYDRVQFGSATRLDARLGEELQFRASYLSGRAVTGTVSLGGEVGWSQSPLDVYDGGLRVARSELEVGSASVLVGLAAERASLLALELRGERAVASTAVAVTDTAESVWLGSAALWFLRESFDRTDFPRRGGRLLVRSELGVSTVAAGGAFSHHVLQLDRRVALHSRVSLVLGAHLGYTAGRDVPPHRRFQLGGDHPSPIFGSTQPTFAGVPAQFDAGTAVHVFRGGVQLEPLADRFVRIWADAGEARAGWRVVPDDWHVGWGVAVGSASIAGPLSVTVTGGNGDLQWSFNVGRRF